MVQATAVMVPSGTHRSASRIADMVRSAHWAAPVAGLLLAALGLLAWWLSAGWLFAAAVALPAALAAHIDVTSHRLPDRLVLLALVPTMVALAAMVAASSAVGMPGAVGAVVLGMLAMGCAPLVAHGCAPAALGFGDVKLSFVLGAALGTWAPALGLAALAAASLVALTESLVRRRNAVAFGPALVAGFLVATVFASPLTARLGGMSVGWLRW